MQLPTFQLVNHLDATTSLKDFLGRRHAWFDEATRLNYDPLTVIGENSKLIDNVLTTLFAGNAVDGRLLEVPTNKMTLVALGGYGRMELGLNSDIDLLFLHRGADQEYIKGVTDSILYPFWNNKIEIGGATRTLGDCKSAFMDEDVRALTAMVDIRFICGDERLFEDLHKEITLYFSDKNRVKKFVEVKIGEHQERLKKYSDPLYMMQPHIKESFGGLREWQTLYWIKKVIAYNLEGVSVPCVLKKPLQFMWKVRNHIHATEGKRSDRLRDAIIEKIALRMQCCQTDGKPSSELLLSEYFKNANLIHSYCNWGINVCSRGFCQSSAFKRMLFSRDIDEYLRLTEYDTIMIKKDVLRISDRDILTAVFEGKKRGMKLDELTKTGILECRSKGEADTIEEGVAEYWRRIFASLDNVDVAITDLFELQLVSKYFDDFAKISYLVVHDGMHVSPVGLHSLEAISQLASLVRNKNSAGDTRQKVPAKALSYIKRPHVLILAILFHDIGKGRGGDHSLIGAQIAARITSKLSYSKTDADDVAFLVRSHLLMPRLAFRRDIREMVLVERFAQSIKSIEIASMLYLLTYVDIRSVGPGVFTEWKQSLLDELFLQTEVYLTEGIKGIDNMKRASEKRVALVKKMGRELPEKDIYAFLATMPERYLFSTDAKTIASHMKLVDDLKESNIVLSYWTLKERGCTELSIVTWDSQGLFSKMAGVLTANGANIIDAQLYTSTDNIAVDIFWITDVLGNPLREEGQWRRIREDLLSVIGGQKDIDYIVGGRFKKRLVSKKRFNRQTTVAFDNDVSATETVIEVTANDRLGLLYSISFALFKMGISIDRARITTHGDTVIDSFYVRDKAGRKIDNTERLDFLKNSLVEAMEG